MEDPSEKNKNIRTYLLKNMTGRCCVELLKLALNCPGMHLAEIKPGKVVMQTEGGEAGWQQVEAIFARYGFEIIHDREKLIVEQIKTAMTDLVQNSTYNAMVRNSDFLVERFGMSYSYISTLFSRHEKQTLEKYTIQLKIEKVKDLIRGGDLTLSEIAYMMGYSSVQYLSTQFKSVTGISVTDYKSDSSTDN